MKTVVTKMFGIDLPIFAFSHCRDVVAEVSKAGGMGVLGISGHSPEELDKELRWIEAQVDGRPYGVDLLIPNTYEKLEQRKLDPERLLPAEHRAYAKRFCDEAGLPPLPEDEADAMLRKELGRINATPEEGQALIEVALRYPGIKLVVNALGTPPKAEVDRLHARGLKVGSLIGKAEHARAQIAAGVDLLVAQGSEAGGHTGSVSSMVLWPQIVDLVAPLPVLAAGGIGRGRQMAAALALGASGVWCGSIWLGTRQSEVDPLMKQRFFDANSEDAIQSRALTGKPCRMLKSRFTEAWSQPQAPKTLPMPLQTLVNIEARLRIDRARASEWMTYPVGQIVGDMIRETTVREVVNGMLQEFVESVEVLGELLHEDASA